MRALCVPAARPTPSTPHIPRAAQVSSLTSFDTELPYDYYTLPFCKVSPPPVRSVRACHHRRTGARTRRRTSPPACCVHAHGLRPCQPHLLCLPHPCSPPPSQPAEGVQRIGNSANPGTVLQGLRIENSPYIFVMKVGAHLELGLGPHGRFGGARKVGAACWSGGRCRPSRQAWGAWGLGHCKSPAPACKVRGGACSGLRTCTHSPCEAAHIRVLRVSPHRMARPGRCSANAPASFPLVTRLLPSFLHTCRRSSGRRWRAWAHAMRTVR